MAVYKSDPPIPDSATTNREKNFHRPLGIVLVESMVEDDPYYSSSSDSDEASTKRRNLGERCDESGASKDVEISNFPAPPPSQPEPVPSSGPGQRILRVPRQRVDSGSTAGSVTPSIGVWSGLGILRASQKLVVKRSNISAAGLRRPAHEPATTREEDVAPESSERPEETPSSAVNVDIPEKIYAAESEEPTACPTTAPPVTEPRDPASPRTSTAVDPNEVPVGLIEDDLLSAELCNESVDSLRRVYKHFKKIVMRSRLKSSILAVKAEGLQDVHYLKQELLEKDVVIAEPAGSITAGSSDARQNEELTRCQRERDQSLRECEELKQANADLEEYKKSMEAV